MDGDDKSLTVRRVSMLKFAFLGAWHSHAPMHVREAAERPDEFQLLGMYDADSEVIERNLQKWREHGLDISSS